MKRAPKWPPIIGLITLIYFLIVFFAFPHGWLHWVNNWSFVGLLGLLAAVVALFWDHFLANSWIKNRNWITPTAATLLIVITGTKEIADFRVNAFNPIKSITGSAFVIFDQQPAILKSATKRVETSWRIRMMKKDEMSPRGKLTLIDIIPTDYAANQPGYSSEYLYKLEFKFLAIGTDRNLGLISADQIAEHFDHLRLHYFIPAGTKYRTLVRFEINDAPAIEIPSDSYLLADEIELYIPLDWSKAKQVEK